MTGSGIYFRQLAEGLARLGFRNGLLYAEQEGLQLQLPSHEMGFPIQFNTPDLPFPIPGMSDEMPYPSTIYSEMDDDMYQQWACAFKQTLQKAKDQFQPDLIISHHVFLMTSIVREVFSDRPVFGISHGTDLRQVKMNPWIKDKYLNSSHRLDRYFSLSPSDAGRLSETFDIPMDKIKVTGGGFDDQIFRPNFESEDDGLIRLIYAGKISYSKGVYELAKAFRQVLTVCPHCQLTYVGNVQADQKARLVYLAGGSERLSFIPALAQKEYGKLLQKSDIYILPSYYEGIALSAIEALATRTRVVISENENLSWLLTQKINQSGVIEYVDLPLLKNVDQPVEEDLPAYVERIAQAIVKQIGRVLSDKGRAWPPQLVEEINGHSWQGLVNEISQEIQEYI